MKTDVTLVNQGSVQAESGQVHVKHYGFLGRMKWAVMRCLLSTVGRMSKGISTGYMYGFDSGSMLDYVYVNKAHGWPGIGTFIDRLYLNAVGWRAIRARRVLLKQVLQQEVERNRAAGVPTCVLDVAAGPGRYLQEFLRECDGQRGDIHILCRDLAEAGLRQGEQLAREGGLQNILYEQGDAFHPAPTEEQLGGAPNIIVVSGLYELILDDETIQQSLQTLYRMLAPGGVIYLTTQTNHPQLDFIANVLPNRDGVLWVMKCRPATQLESWARNAGFTQVYSQAEEVGLFTVTMGSKTA